MSFSVVPPALSRPLDVLSQFHIELTEEVIRDIGQAGKTFKTDLTLLETPVRRAAGDLTLEPQRCSSKQVAVQLEKLGESLINLLITVYKLDTTDITTSTQTELQISRDSDVQTDKEEYVEADAQTDTPALRTEECQTRESRVRQRFANVRTETDSNLGTQTSVGVSAVVHTKGIRLQATPSTSVAVCQTVACTSEAGVQAEPLGVVSEVQTDTSMAWMADGCVQATVDVVESQSQTELICSDSVSQTTLCMLHPSESVTQTDISIANMTEGVCQTDSSMSLMSDIGLQVSVTVGDGVSQTECVLDDRECQTVISIFQQVDNQTQFDRVQEVDSETQVDPVIEVDQETQVEHIISVDRETQVDPTTEADGQTQVDQICLSEKESQAVVTSQEGTSQYESMPSFNADDTLPVDAGDGDSVYDTSMLNYTDITTPVKGGQDRSVVMSRSSTTLRDGVAQTDPVTIIIGDASFLVKKLKSSAVNPSKVTTTGNEIEIELSADAPVFQPPESNDQYATTDRTGVMVGKENSAGMTYGSSVSGYQAQGGGRGGRVEGRGGYPAQGGRGGGVEGRGGYPAQGGRGGGGVITRGGGGNGARMRMPVTHTQIRSPVVQRAVTPVQQQQQQQRMATYQSPNNTPRMVARQQVTPVTRQPQPSPSTVSSAPGYAGPAPVVGGSFSCPFCSVTFIDSPALYEHLSINHMVDQQAKWKQPRGREGKTIRGGKSRNSTSPSGGGEVFHPPASPSLPKKINKTTGQQQQQQRVSLSKNLGHTDHEEEEEDEQEEAGLFEDPIEHVRKSNTAGGGGRGGGATSRGGVSSPRGGGALKRRGGGSVDAERASGSKRRNVAPVEDSDEEEDEEEVSPEPVKKPPVKKPGRGRGRGRGGKK